MRAVILQALHVRTMTLIRIAPPAFDVDLALAYATADNFTGKPVYAPDAQAYLHIDAAACLARACELAKAQGWRLRLFDAFRPQAAQWVFWNQNPDPDFVADPRRGSPHSRGVAVDLTLLDADGTPFAMGTPFDDFTTASHHGSLEIDAEAQRNRFLLLGLMTAAGWDSYRNEWWHYQLFDARARYPLIEDADSPVALVGAEPKVKRITRSGTPDRRQSGARAAAARRGRRSRD
jgi:D-alanyl-D-alanine dipeptidase